MRYGWRLVVSRCTDTPPRSVNLTVARMRRRDEAVGTLPWRRMSAALGKVHALAAVFPWPVAHRSDVPQSRCGGVPLCLPPGSMRWAVARAQTSGSKKSLSAATVVASLWFSRQPTPRLLRGAGACQKFMFRSAKAPPVVGDRVLCLTLSRWPGQGTRESLLPLAPPGCFRLHRYRGRRVVSESRNSADIGPF